MSLNYNTKRIKKPSAVFGCTSDYLTIDDCGRVGLVGSAKGMMTIRPSIQYDEINKAGKPDLATYGVNTFYSLPIYNDDNEEIFTNSRVPYRWDGLVAPRFRLLTCLTGSETVGHAIKLSAAYSSVATAESLATSPTVVTAERKVLAGRNSIYSCYSFTFNLEGDIAPRDKLSIRLQRVAASTATDVSNEVGIADWVIEYSVDKMYGEWMS